jgi:signal peptidase I
MKDFARDMVVTILVAVLSFFLLNASVQSCVVYGSSMEPTVAEKQRLLISKIAYYFQPPGRGDIIVFEPSSKQQPDYIKRIIGLPGDTVEIQGGSVYVNGQKLDEPYIKSAPRYTLPAKLLAENNYFVLGDNRNNSNDSHNGWTIPRENIVGKVWLRFWPPADWGIMSAGRLFAPLAYSGDLPLRWVVSSLSETLAVHYYENMGDNTILTIPAKAGIQ